jgi:ribosome maturation protein SDO1
MIQTPVNQVRLTNVAVVKHKAKGKRFEIACYKNKVQNYRDNVEQNLNEVLQIYEIFTNVSKGEFAKKTDIKNCLHSDKDEAIKIILEKGSVQVSELERDSEFETLKLKIANTVSTMCVNKDTNVPFPVPIILKAMDDLKFHVKEGQNGKRQALQLIKELPKVLPLERAKMKVKFLCKDEAKKEEIKKLMATKFSKSGDEVLSILEMEQKTEG